MSDDSTPKFELVEMPADEAPRDLETEIKIAWSTIEALKSQMLEMESFNSQLQDTFRLNVAATILGALMTSYEDADDEIMARAIAMSDKFLAHYVGIMQKNAAEYARRITEGKRSDEPVVEEQAADTATIN